MQGHKDATAPDSEPAKAKMVSAEGGGGEKSKTRVNLSSNAIAGTIAGFTSSSLTHPLDVVKTRFQVLPRPRHTPLPALARLSKARESAVSKLPGSVLVLEHGVNTCSARALSLATRVA